MDNRLNNPVDNRLNTENLPNKLNSDNERIKFSLTLVELAASLAFIYLRLVTKLVTKLSIETHHA